MLNGAMTRTQTSHWISNKEAKNSCSGSAGWSLTSLGKKWPGGEQGRRDPFISIATGEANCSAGAAGKAAAGGSLRMFKWSM